MTGLAAAWARPGAGHPDSRLCSPWVLADFVCSVQPGAADGVACDGGNHLVKGEARWQTGGLVKGEELENISVGSV